MSADLWSFGCMCYEFITGQVPFGEDLEDPYKVYEAVLTGKVVFPRIFPHHSTICTFIHGLINRNPGLRGTPTSLKTHKFFKHFEWQDMVHKKLKAPFVNQPEEVTRQIKKSMEVVLREIEREDE